MPDGALAWATVVIGLCGAGGFSGYAVNWLTNRTTREKNWYDQLQEDREGDRNDITQLKADVAELKRIDKVKDDYIMALRQDISDGKPPPPRPWPEALRGVTAS